VSSYNTAIIAGLSGPLIEHVYFPSSSLSFQASMTGVLVSCILVGAFIGTMISLPLTNRWGRKISLIVCGLICCGACIGMGFVENFIGLVLLRTVLGLSVGMTTTVCPLYSAECSPVNKRGAVGTVYQVRGDQTTS
jgi:SP family sugar:H+ symporter-like MFS transporter